MSETILLTGATGFLGTWIAGEFLRATDAQLIALVRAENDIDALARLRRAWWDNPDLAEHLGGRIQALAGDIARPNLGLAPEAFSGLSRSVTRIVHAAADLRLQAPLAELRRTNVQGTGNLLELGRAAHRHHGLGRFVHVSTAYVAGNRRGEAREEELTDEYGFANDYERTKYEAEALVQAAKRDLPVTVLRPGMVVGDSRTGAIKAFNTVYYPLRLYLGGRHRLLPLSPSLRVNMVPVDYIAEAAVRLALNPAAAGLTFHLTAPCESLPDAGELVAFVRAWARQNLGLELPRPAFLPVPLLRGRNQAKGPIGKLASLGAYLHERRVFNRDNLDRLCGPYLLDWREYLPNLLAYATACGFMHRSGRTVHEQVFFRLGGLSRPAIYHDIIGGKLYRRTAAELRGEIAQAAAALRASGICPGDRVGITGLNSTRYFSLDTAIGLIGAVSVPIYYTSPPAEVETIVADSDARMLLLGSPLLLPRLSHLAGRLPVVSFCHGILPPDAAGIIPWEEFLARGGEVGNLAAAPVDPDDAATIRYTSGTTGRPKGVVFTHRQLRWMAETVAALPPWPVRNRPVSYLSFLPMSHVVEGILGAYAPYYAPARLEIFFLREFQALSRALPMARPTFFFSVPRFYEKLWEKLSGSRLGRLWLSTGGGARGRLLRPLLRRTALHRAGLDRCGYLVMGSAPADEELLRKFAALGIPVHNAYGLTEAPLVTINRPGRILRGTVGEPLPETEIRLARDGEILVRGPQVTFGYYGGAGTDEPARDGWLHTGDLGRLLENGGLAITGRRKDLIMTSYGKNVAPLKVENMLRRLPGVVEAMLLGEGRPHCAALLWVDPEKTRTMSWEGLDRAMLAVNNGLSRPEQAKSWAILPYDLSIEAGELTANLKLRREAIAGRLADILAALYEAGRTPGQVLHIGRTSS